jgi:hypothetical protein
VEAVLALGHDAKLIIFLVVRQTYCAVAMGRHLQSCTTTYFKLEELLIKSSRTRIPIPFTNTTLHQYPHLFGGRGVIVDNWEMVQLRTAQALHAGRYNLLQQTDNVLAFK